LTAYAHLEKDFQLENVQPGTFRRRIQAGIAKLTKQFFPDGEDKPGKFDMEKTLVAYEKDDKSYILIEGKFI